MRADLLKVLDHLRCEAGGLSDGQLLARFVASRDQAAFEGLVRRHGKMVYGVCLRILRNSHDAEDVFQKTFLTLARKAASVVKRESFGSWLYHVAYHAALDAAASSFRRRSIERQVKTFPHPVVSPAEPEDWRPFLDLELSRLPEKYRAAVVLCDLEGLSRREAARLLGIPEGTLSSRLTTAHRMLAKRLARCGLALSVCAVSAALAEARASAGVPLTLVKTVAQAAAAGSWPAVVFLKGVFQTMFLSKWWPVAGAVVVALSLAAVGVGFKSGDAPGTAQAAPQEKSLSELEALRKEVELLKLNLQIVLEKNRALEAELQALRGPKGEKLEPKVQDVPAGKAKLAAEEAEKAALIEKLKQEAAEKAKAGDAKAAEAAKAALIEKMKAEAAAKAKAADKAVEDKLAGTNEKIIQELEAALKELKGSKDPEAQKRLAEALEKALKKMKDKPGR